MLFRLPSCRQNPASLRKIQLADPHGQQLRDSPPISAATLDEWAQPKLGAIFDQLSIMPVFDKPRADSILEVIVQIGSQPVQPELDIADVNAQNDLVGEELVLECLRVARAQPFDTPQ
jgi:hypothetical protein